MLIYPGLKRFVFIDVSILHPPHTQTHTHTHRHTHKRTHNGVQGEIKVDDSYSSRLCCLTLDSTTLHTGIHPAPFHTQTLPHKHTQTHTCLDLVFS